MGGKQKQSQRTKNNARPASSGRSAELLGSSIPSFVGFNPIKEGSFVPLAVAGDSIEQNLATEYQLVLKKLSKKDSTTKLKALQELTQLVESGTSEDAINILPHWPRFYCLLAIDPTHRVREATQVAHRVIASKCGRSIARYLKLVVPVWLTSQFDTFPPAATQAQVSLENTFPGDKLADVMVFCKNEILAYISDNLIVHTPTTLSNPQTFSPEECEQKFERVVTISLQGYGSFVCNLPPAQVEWLCESQAKILDSDKFWKFASSKISQIRSAWFTLIGSISQRLPEWFGIRYGKKVTKILIGNLNEKDPVVATNVWDTFLTFISNFKDWCCDSDFAKNMGSALLRTLREGGRGNAGKLAPLLLPLLAYLPAPLANKEFHLDFFDAMLKGLEQPNLLASKYERKSWLTGLCECIKYISIHQINTFAIDILPPLLRHWLEFVFRVRDCQIRNAMAKCSGNLLSSLIKYWIKQSTENTDSACHYDSLIRLFWGNTKLVIISEIENMETDIAKIKECTDCHIEFLSSLKCGCISTNRRKSKVTFEQSNDKDEVQPKNEMEIETFTPDKHSNDRFLHNLDSIVNEVASQYLLYAKTKEVSTPILGPLFTLVIEFCSKDLFLSMARTVLNVNHNENVTLVYLYSKLLKIWLTDDTMRSKAVIDILYAMFPYLKEDELKEILQSFCQFVPSVLEMILFKSLAHPHNSNDHVRAWLKTETVGNALVSVCQKLVKEGDRQAKTLLKMGFTLDNNGELLISDLACKTIMGVLCGSLMNVDSPHLDVCASFTCELATTLFLENDYSDMKLLLLQMFKLNCSVMPEDEENPNISQDTWLEVKTSWQDALSCLQESDALWFIEKSVKIIHHSLFNCNEREVEKEKIERLIELSVGLISGLIKEDNSIEENAKTTTKTVNILLDYNNSNKCYTYDHIYRMALKYDIILGNLNCPNIDDACESLKSVVESSEICKSEELSLQDIVQCIKHSLFMSKFIKSFLTRSLAYNKDDCENVDSDADECSDKVIDDIIVEDNNWIVAILKDESILSQLYTLLEYIVVLRSIDTAYRFWQHYIILDYYNEFVGLYKDIFGMLPSEIKKEIQIFLENKSSSNGYYWSICNKYYIRDLMSNSKESDKNNTFVNIVKCDEDFFTGSGYFHSLQATLLFKKLQGTVDCELIYRTNAELALRCYFHAHCTSTAIQSQPDLALKPEELEKCGTEKYQYLTLFVNKYYQCNNIMLYDIDLTTASWNHLCSNLTIVRLLDSAVKLAGWDLQDIHWDFITISLSSLMHSIDKSKHKWNCTKVIMLSVAVLELFITVETFISAIPAQCLKREPSIPVANLPQEWTDIFAPDLHKNVFMITKHIYEDILKNNPHLSIQANECIILNALAKAMHHLNWDYVKNSNQASELNIDSMMSLCLKILAAPCSHIVKYTSYATARVLTKHLTAIDVESYSRNLEDESTESTVRATLAVDKVQETLSNLQESVNAVLYPYKLCEDHCVLLPFNDSYSLALGYFLMWELLFDVCTTTHSQLAYQYVQFFKEGKYIESLTENVMKIMPAEVLIYDESPSVTSTTISTMFQTRPTLDTSENPSSQLITWLACHALYSALSGPCAGIVRGWWGAAPTRASRAFGTLVASYVSPGLVRSQLDEVVAKQATMKQMQITVHPVLNEVVLEFVFEDRNVELTVQLQPNHPLSIPMVAARGTPIERTQWLAMYLYHQNRTLWETLRLWYSSVNRRLEMSAVCYVCYCRLHPQTGQLPKTSCKRCQNKFHRICLTKWFDTSKKKTCPICRNDFKLNTN